MNSKIVELCKKANLPKPQAYTSFVWMRSLGNARISAASDLGVSDKTLERWENKVNENLTGNEFAELVVLAINFEFDKRFKQE